MLCACPHPLSGSHTLLLAAPSPSTKRRMQGQLLHPASPTGLGLRPPAHSCKQRPLATQGKVLFKAIVTVRGKPETRLLVTPPPRSVFLNRVRKTGLFTGQRQDVPSGQHLIPQYQSLLALSHFEGCGHQTLGDTTPLLETRMLRGAGLADISQMQPPSICFQHACPLCAGPLDTSSVK